MSEQSTGTNGKRVRDSTPSRSWYEVLEVPRNASEEQITAAYRRALKLIDGQNIGGYLMLDPAAAESARQDVEKAFLVLSDPERRAHFDRQLQQSESGEAATEIPRSDRRKKRRRGRRGRRRGERGGPGQDSVIGAADLESPTLPVGPAEVDDDEPDTEADVAPLEDASTVRPTAKKPRRPLVRFLSPIEAKGEQEPTSPRPPPSPDADTERPAERRRWVYGENDVEGVAERPRVIDSGAPAGRWPAEVDERTLPPEGEINGGVIRRLREARDISLDELAAQTHISKHYLQAIEDQQLDDLPARVYLRGFLTQVGRVLKVDKKRLAEGYLTFVERYRSR